MTTPTNEAFAAMDDEDRADLAAMLADIRKSISAMEERVAALSAHLSDLDVIVTCASTMFRLSVDSEVAAS